MVMICVGTVHLKKFGVDPYNYKHDRKKKHKVCCKVYFKKWIIREYKVLIPFLK